MWISCAGRYFTIYMCACFIYPIQVKSFFAKQFSVRERGLREVQQCLSSVSSLSRGEINVWVRGTSELIWKALRDNVFSVSWMGVEILLRACNIVWHLVNVWLQTYSTYIRMESPQGEYVIDCLHFDSDTYVPLHVHRTVVYCSCLCFTCLDFELCMPVHSASLYVLIWWNIYLECSVRNTSELHVHIIYTYMP